MESLEVLYTLVHSLTDQERADIILSLPISGNETHQKILFSILEKEKNFIPYKIESQWRLYDKKKNLKLKALDNTKHLLKQSILNSLSKTHLFLLGGESEKALYYAEVFIQRNLPEEAMHTLEFYLHHPDIYIHPQYKVMLIQRMLWLIPLLKLTAASKKRNQLLADLQKATDDFNLFTRIYVFNNVVQTFYSKTAIMKSSENKKTLASLNKNKLLQLSIDKLSHTNQAYLIRTKIALNHLNFESDQHFKNQSLLCNVMKKYEQQYLKSAAYMNYCIEFVNLATLSAMQKNEPKLLETISYIEKIATLQKRFTGILLAQCALVHAMYFYYTKNESELEDKIIIADESIQLIYNQVSPLHQNNFRVGIMKAMLQLKKYERIEFWFQKNTGKKPLVRVDNHFIVFVIYICSQYEQFTFSENKRLVEVSSKYATWCKALKSMFKESAIQLPLEITIGNAFIALSESNNRAMHVEIFTRLLSKLSQLPAKGHTYQEQFYKIFNLYNWILEMVERLKKE